jgi:hypothetical protein
MLTLEKITCSANTGLLRKTLFTIVSFEKIPLKTGLKYPNKKFVMIKSLCNLRYLIVQNQATHTHK